MHRQGEVKKFSDSRYVVTDVDVMFSGTRRIQHINAIRGVPPRTPAHIPNLTILVPTYYVRLDTLKSPGRLLLRGVTINLIGPLWTLSDQN